MSLQLRYLQTLAEVAVENNSTIVFPIPIDLLKPFIEMTAQDHQPDGTGPIEPPPVLLAAGTSRYRAPRTIASMACTCASRAGKSASLSMFGPSEGALSGSGWTSINSASTPTCGARQERHKLSLST